MRGIIELVHGLGKQVVAEGGVETAEALEFLLLVGCDTGQGYHWSRPIPATELVDWIAQRTGPRTRAPADAGGPAIPGGEAARLAALRDYRIFDTA